MLNINRHVGIFDPVKFDTPVHVIGAGATGSWLTLQLAKLGVQDINVWDFDKVEDHNLANQLFGPEHVGMEKVVALAKIVKQLTGMDIKVKNEKVEAQRLAGIVFVLTDTMSSRKQIFDNCIKMNPNVKLMVETRMGVDLGNIYTICGTELDEIKFWESRWVEDDKISEVSACGSKITVGATASMLAAHAVWQMIRFYTISQGEKDEIEHEVIFSTRSIQTMTNTL